MNGSTKCILVAVAIVAVIMGAITAYSNTHPPSVPVTNGDSETMIVVPATTIFIYQERGGGFSVWKSGYGDVYVRGLEGNRLIVGKYNWALEMWSQGGQIVLFIWE